jgi:ketosteroid isomerase-like protein
MIEGDPFRQGPAMTTSTSTTTDQETTDQETADRLSAAFHRCFTEFTAADGLFADDAFFDLLPPMWRFQFEGPGAAFAAQLRSIAKGPAEIEVVRTVPTATGFATEHVETQHTPTGNVTARRLHLCEVADGRITAVTTYCNGGWDDELRARHAAEAPMVRP